MSDHKIEERNIGKAEVMDDHLQQQEKKDDDSLTSSSSPAQSKWKIRLSALFSRKFLTILLLGQVLSLCITATTLFSTKLAQGENPVSIPTTQSFLNYFVLGVVYTSITLYKEGFSGWIEIIRRRSPYCKSYKTSIIQCIFFCVLVLVLLLLLVQYI